ncbi:unnamed protein product, partial [Ilex paraguariensis]
LRFLEVGFGRRELFGGRVECRRGGSGGEVAEVGGEGVVGRRGEECVLVEKGVLGTSGNSGVAVLVEWED